MSGRCEGQVEWGCHVRSCEGWEHIIKRSKHPSKPTIMGVVGRGLADKTQNCELRHPAFQGPNRTQAKAPESNIRISDAGRPEDPAWAHRGGVPVKAVCAEVGHSFLVAVMCCEHGSF